MKKKPAFDFVQLDRNSEVPIYIQIQNALLLAIAGGQLNVGDRLPPVRALAENLDVNTMTVARVYKELTNKGALAGRGALGTFVMDAGGSRKGAGFLSPDPSMAFQEQDSDQPGDTFRRMLEISDIPGIIPFTRAYPDGHVIDVGAFEDAARAVLDERPDHLYSYCSPDGLPVLKEAFCKLLSDTGIDKARSSDIVVTTGGQQGINLVVNALLRPGDVVITERPTYFGALDLFRSRGIRTVGVDLELDGPNIEQLERALSSVRPKLMFLMPTFHNPTGITTSIEKRKRIVELSRKHGVPIIEDDHCPEIRFKSSHLPSLKALADPNDNIYYVRGLGKAYVPGVRLGFVLSPRNKTSGIIAQKVISDLHTSPILQEAMARYLVSGASSQNLKKMQTFYKKVQQVLESELPSNGKNQCEIVFPDGGFNLWIKLPKGCDATELYFNAAQNGVAVLVGTPLFPDDSRTQAIRVSYGVGNLDLARSGAKRLSAAIKDTITSRPRRVPVVV